MTIWYKEIRHWFQHTAARRRLVLTNLQSASALSCFNTQPPEGGWVCGFRVLKHSLVSTHSRPKAAGNRYNMFSSYFDCFNTQPPEGGWRLCNTGVRYPKSFNTQPPEGGWIFLIGATSIGTVVSTHSRPKAAGQKKN